MSSLSKPVRNVPRSSSPAMGAIAVASIDGRTMSIRSKEARSHSPPAASANAYPSSLRQPISPRSCNRSRFIASAKLPEKVVRSAVARTALWTGPSVCVSAWLAKMRSRSGSSRKAGRTSSSKNVSRARSRNPFTSVVETSVGVRRRPTTAPAPPIVFAVCVPIARSSMTSASPSRMCRRKSVPRNSRSSEGRRVVCVSTPPAASFSMVKRSWRRSSPLSVIRVSPSAWSMSPAADPRISVYQSDTAKGSSSTLSV